MEVLPDPPIHPNHLASPWTAYEKNDLWGFKNGKGDVVVEPKYVMAQDFNRGGIAPVVKDGDWVYIDGNENVLVKPLVVDNAPDAFGWMYARFVEDGKIGFFDESGRVVIDPQFDFAFPFCEGLAVFCEECEELPGGERKEVKGGRWGVIDEKGDVVIPPRFEDVKPPYCFDDNRIEVKLDGEWITIDSDGDQRH